MLFASLLVLAAMALPPIAQAAPGEQGCDPLDPAVCLQPWPNDLFTVADPSTDTGRRLNLNPLAMPRNVGGNPIRPGEWNRKRESIAHFYEHNSGHELIERIHLADVRA